MGERRGGVVLGLCREGVGLGEGQGVCGESIKAVWLCTRDGGRRADGHDHECFMRTRPGGAWWRGPSGLQGRWLVESTPSFGLAPQALQQIVHSLSNKRVPEASHRQNKRHILHGVPAPSTEVAWRLREGQASGGQSWTRVKRWVCTSLLMRRTLPHGRDRNPTVALILKSAMAASEPSLVV